MKRYLLLVTGLCTTLMCTVATAREAGDWMGRLGFHYVDPQSHNHEVVKVEGTGAVTGAVTYFVTPTLALDLLVAMPFEHDIELAANGRKAATVQHLPPTLSLAWFPGTPLPLKPFVGIGLNYTTFFQEKTQGALEGSRLRLDDSFGLAMMVGVQYELADDFSLMADVRHVDIDSEAHLDGESLGKVHIDPWAYGLALAYHF